ncbi:MAG: ABC transporter ATP-binding protein [Oligoflexales bacterium]
MIEVSKLTRKYGTFTAVKGVSFSIPKGQIVGLLGHNGAGKTTTLKVLTGYLEATSGDVTIDGKDIKDHMLDIQARIGYLPENSPLYPDMTVVQYLDYVAQLRSMPSESIGRGIREAIEATDLGSKSGEKIGTLSKGYRQRVGVAQAIIHRPDILVLDEPTNGLDPTQILAMRKLIKDLSQSATVILSTHIMQEVEAICDRVIIVLDGRIVIDSLLADLRKGNCIQVGLKESMNEVKPVLSSITGIEGVSVGNSSIEGINQYVVEAKGDDPAIAASVAKAVVDNGWSLYALHRDQRDLETVFREANSGSKGAAHV